jgi:hypothetical protein
MVLAIPEIGLGAIIVFVLLVLLAFVVLKLVAMHATPDIHIPLIGNLRTKVGDGFDAAIDGITGALDGMIGAFGDIIHGIVRFSQYIWYLAAGWVSQAYHTVAWVVTTYVPRETAKLARSIESHAVTLGHDISHALTSAEAYAERKVTALATTVAHNLAHAISKAESDIAAVKADVSGLLAHAESYALAKAQAAEQAAKAAASAALSTTTKALDNELHKIESTTTSAIAKVEGDLTTVKNEVGLITSTTLPALVTDINGDIEDALGDLGTTVAAGITGLEGVIGSDFADVKALLDQLADVNLGTIVGTSVATAAALGILTKLAEDCIVPQCRNLGGLSNILGDLAGILEAGTLLAFLAELATNPAGFTEDVISVGGPIADPIISGAGDLLNVPV